MHTTLDIAVAGLPASPPTQQKLSREQEQVALGMHSFAYGKSHFDGYDSAPRCGFHSRVVVYSGDVTKGRERFALCSIENW